MALRDPLTSSFASQGFPAMHVLKATPETVHWGFFSAALKPVLTVDSGDVVCVEAVTQHAGDAPDLMMDEGVRAIYEQVDVSRRAPGCHIMTGPIAVRGAKPGTMLEVRYLSMRPRVPYGSNLTADWGYLYDETDRKERVTIFKIDDFSQTATPYYAYDVDGRYDTVGRIVKPTEKPVYFQNPLRVPLRLHVGTAGLAPAGSDPVSTVPPGEHGGNMDNWGVGPGATVYYPVQVDGGLFSVGDPHAAQGDSEITGTAIETSMDVMMQLKVRDDVRFDSPILATPEYFMVHGFNANLNDAMRQAALRMLAFLTDICGMNRDDAYTLMSVAVDFSVTQVVDERFGIHAKIARNLLGNLPV
ncbi:acetamidase/formamidase family protein [Mailhella sp.]|uniref:acetamidase/formamidase family protein n=1 Tax=Mailhella sp. TaxID=1981029 RepID=UPI003AB269CF